MENKVELCAISKDFAIKQLNVLIEANKELFAEYDAWVTIINSKVEPIINKEEVITTDEELVECGTLNIKETVLETTD